MNTVLVAVNARYTHSSLALRYLSEAYRAMMGRECIRLEFHVNQPQMAVFDGICGVMGDHGTGRAFVGFAVYIWNRSMVLGLARMVKAAYPGAVVALGGPEVAHEPDGVFKEAPEMDLVFTGEGEIPFPEVALRLENGCTDLARELADIPGVAVNPSLGGSRHTLPSKTVDMACLPNPYASGFAGISGRIAYYETTRGCPFKCSYCLSSLTGGVRSLPMDRVKEELLALSGSGALQLKFVDRTFNSNGPRAREIWGYLIGISPSAPPYPMTYHFEMGADLMTEADLDLLATAPPGLFQFEVGVQSITPHVLKGICRTMDTGALARNVGALTAAGRVAVNLDLIAGLPGETHDSFMDGLDFCLHLKPSGIHLGLLKMLPGSDIRARAAELGLRYSPTPPYQVVATGEMSPGELARIRGIEEILDAYWNSGRFKASLPLAMATMDKPSGFLTLMADQWGAMGLAGVNHKQDKEYDALLEAFGPRIPSLAEALAYDRLAAGLPSTLARKPGEDEARTLRSMYPDSRETGRRWVVAGFGCDPRPGHNGGPVTLAFGYGPPSKGRTPEAITGI